jgi:hypothetical protein
MVVLDKTRLTGWLSTKLPSKEGIFVALMVVSCALYRYNTSMLSPEVNPHGAIGFLEVARRLGERDALVLSRNRVQVIRNQGVVQTQPVHYEGLNFLTQVYQPISVGALVTDEFRSAALKAESEKDALPPEMYPLMTVINHTTEQRLTRPVNVAGLLVQGELPVYSVPARHANGGEMLRLGMSTFIKRMAGQVGVNPVGAVVIEDGGVHTIEEMGPSIWTHLPTRRAEQFSDEPLFDPRSMAALALLQMDIATAFAHNRHTVTKNENGRTEVVARVVTQPDLQTLLLSLIDMVEAKGLRLHYRNEGIATGEMGSAFGLADQSFLVVYDLSAEPTVDMAAYNAYLAASEIFNDQ